MTITRNVTAELYNALKTMLPDLPPRTRKPTLTLETGQLPVVEVEYLPLTNDAIKAPTEFKAQTYALCPVGDDGLIDVTCLGDSHERYAKREPAAPRICTGGVTFHLLERVKPMHVCCREGCACHVRDEAVKAPHA